MRRITNFGELLAGARRPKPGDLADRLGPWMKGREFGWLFDNANDRLDLAARVMATMDGRGGVEASGAEAMVAVAASV